ncbi:MAG: hypothetical protein ACPGVO_07485 [Spirulinaceae cyanobacterium]
MSPVSTNQLSIFELVGYLFSGIYCEFIFVIALFLTKTTISDEINDFLGTSFFLKEFPIDLSIILSPAIIVPGILVLAYGLGILCSQFSLFYYYGDNRDILRWIFTEPYHYPFKLSYKMHKTYQEQHQNQDSSLVKYHPYSMMMPWPTILESLNKKKIIPDKAMSTIKGLSDKDKFSSFRENKNKKREKDIARKTRLLVDRICEKIALSSKFLFMIDRIASRIRFASSIIVTNLVFSGYLFLLISISKAESQDELFSFFFGIFIAVLALLLRLFFRSFIYPIHGIEPKREFPNWFNKLPCLLEMAFFLSSSKFIIITWAFVSLFSIKYDPVITPFLIIFVIMTILMHREIAQKSANEYWMTIALACTLYCRELDQQASFASDLLGEAP